jgi:hypothetical protein
MLLSFTPYLKPKEIYCSMNSNLGVGECENSISREKINESESAGFYGSWGRGGP